MCCAGVATPSGVRPGAPADMRGPRVVGNTGLLARVAGGYLHSCAVGSNGAVRCWGFGSFGELGDGQSTTRCSPVAASRTSPRGTSRQAARTPARSRRDGRIWCWGANRYAAPTARHGDPSPRVLPSIERDPGERGLVPRVRHHGARSSAGATTTRDRSATRAGSRSATRPASCPLISLFVNRPRRCLVQVTSSPAQCSSYIFFFILLGDRAVLGAQHARGARRRHHRVAQDPAARGVLSAAPPELFFCRGVALPDEGVRPGVKLTSLVRIGLTGFVRLPFCWRDCTPSSTLESPSPSKNQWSSRRIP